MFEAKQTEYEEKKKDDNSVQFSLVQFSFLLFLLRHIIKM